MCQAKTFELSCKEAGSYIEKSQVGEDVISLHFRWITQWQWYGTTKGRAKRDTKAKRKGDAARDDLVVVSACPVYSNSYPAIGFRS